MPVTLPEYRPDKVSKLPPVLKLKPSQFLKDGNSESARTGKLN